jgi:hypothetical protein
MLLGLPCLATAAALAFSPARPAAVRHQQAAVGAIGASACRVPPAAMLFGASWPWERSAGSDDESGKFLRHSNLQPGCAPLGVVTAGLMEDELEALADTIEGVTSGPDGAISHVPIAVLSQSDLRYQLRDVLARLDERDSVLPDRPCVPAVPLVLLSGFSATQTSAMVRALRAADLLGGEGGKQRPMFAAVVPNALTKTLRMLIDEIDGDRRANAEQGAPPGSAPPP